jgi:hypothetical protein
MGRVFREPWSDADGTADLDETWVHGVLIGGMGSEHNQLSLASAYAEAAGMLVDAAVASEEAWKVCYPIFYLYRHALELYFKDVLPKHRRDHDLARLVSEYDEFSAQPVPARPARLGPRGSADVGGHGSGRAKFPLHRRQGRRPL